MKISIDVDKRTLELLALLDERGVQQAVRYLIGSRTRLMASVALARGRLAASSWEPKLGEHKLEQDPDVHWYERPRRR